ncbi:MAG: hypothetical protein PHV23_01580 [Candidatus Gracilibacteria bacterium]|nr:hypothetical protein [Candidatus Gracilibacteria bacterium]
MAFSSIEMMSSMGNHSSIVANNNENIKDGNASTKDCTSICCYDTDYLNAGINVINTQNLKKKIDKIKHCYLDISLGSNPVSELKYIGNTLPPIYYLYENYKDKSYKNLVGIIKSNT